MLSAAEEKKLVASLDFQSEELQFLEPLYRSYLGKVRRIDGMSVAKACVY